MRNVKTNLELAALGILNSIAFKMNNRTWEFVLIERATWFRAKWAWREWRSRQSIGVQFPRIATVLRSMNVLFYVLFINRNPKNHRPIDLSMLMVAMRVNLESVEDDIAALWRAAMVGSLI